MRPTNKIFNIFKLFNTLTLQGNLKSIPREPSLILMRSITTSSPRKDLMEFFDNQKYWGANEVKSGRSWNKEEMRLKSNSDLHKLWYILLKEKNMLLTMEQEAKDQTRLFPSPERLDKVEMSMENLEAVIRERNKAYHELETGETGERPGKLMKSAFGLMYYYKMCEYPIPKFLNKKWQEKYKFYKHDKDVENFLLKYREKLYLNKKRKQTRDFNHVIGLLNRFPNMDMEALKEQYPDVDIKKAKNSRKYGGQFEPKLSANGESRKEWIDALQPKGPLPKYAQICAEHFLPSDYYLSNNKKYLRKNTIPGILQFRSGTVAMGLPTDDGSLSDIQPLPKTCQDLNRKSLLRTSSTSGITGKSQGFPSLVNDPKEIHIDSSSSTSTAPSTPILVTKTLSLN